jgi:hypothetical protein
MWCNPAQVSALCRLTALQSCVLLEPWLVVDLDEDEATVLAQLSALQQLTSLALDATRRQLQHLPQLPQLQVLQVRIQGHPSRQPLQLGHLTSLVRLVVADVRGPLLAADQLPPNLRQLAWIQERRGWDTLGGNVKRSHSLQPLLALELLEELHLQMPGAANAAAELSQLSSISSLQELRLDCSVCPGSGFDSSAALAWSKLPLKSLRVSIDEVTAGFVQQRTVFKHLTSLSLTHELGTTYERKTFSSAVTSSQLAAVLTQLPGLQVLALDLRRSGMNAGSSSSEGVSTKCATSSGCVEGGAALVEAIGGLQQLGIVQVRLPVELDAAAVQQLSSMPSSLAARCNVKTDLLSIVT